MGTSEQSVNPPDAPPPSREAILVLDAAVGASLLAAAAAQTVGRRVGGASARSGAGSGDLSTRSPS